MWHATGARMGPHGTLHFVGEKSGSNHEGPEQSSSGGGSSTEISGQHVPLAIDVRRFTRSSARRNKVYDNIMRQWEKAASSMVPMPRSSHRRILGGQALPTRQASLAAGHENVGATRHESRQHPPPVESAPPRTPPRRKGNKADEPFYLVL